MYDFKNGKRLLYSMAKLYRNKNKEMTTVNIINRR